MPEGIKVGFQGATPKVEVKPLDETLPVCGLLVTTVVPPTPCTRKKGHYGPCGVKGVTDV